MVAVLTGENSFAWQNVLDVKELDEEGLALWLVAAAKAQGGKLSPADARFLVARVGVVQQLLAGELEKLLLYAPEITQQTIEMLVEATPQSKIFDLLEA